MTKWETNDKIINVERGDYIMIKYISNNKELLDKLKELEIKNNKIKT